MNRRTFLQHTSAGLLATAVAPGVWILDAPRRPKKRYAFRPYRPGHTLAPVTIVTPADGFYLHTFYDVCPFSPSRRYLAVTKVPYQGRKPVLGDVAQVGVIDLREETMRIVYATRAWSFQLGAQVQWGTASDRFLYTNDIIDGRAVGVRIDLEAGSVTAYAGPKYDLAPDESYIVGGKLEYMNATQYGYGLPDGPGGEPRTLRPEDIDREGLWRTDLATDEVRLLVPFRRFQAHTADPDYYEGGTFYCFHTKVNRPGTRIMQVIRWVEPDGSGRNASLFTLNPDGTDLVQAVDRATWNVKAALGGAGNHPNWHPDGEHIIMNLVPKHLGYENMRFCQFRYDGSGLRVLSEQHLGSGHPSVNAASTYLLADSYPKQTYVTLDNGEIPIRLLHLPTDEERRVCSVSVDLGTPRNAPSVRKTGGSHFKLDPHPAWGREYRQICFNGVVDGARQVFVADLSGVL